MIPATTTRLKQLVCLLVILGCCSVASAQIPGTWVKAVPGDLPGGNTVRASDGATGGWYDGPTTVWSWPHYPNWFAYSGDGGLNAAGQGGTSVDHYSLVYIGENSPPLDTLRTTVSGLDPMGVYDFYVVYNTIPWASGSSGVKIGLTGQSQISWTDQNGTDTGFLAGTLPVYRGYVGQTQAVGGTISVDVDALGTASNTRTYYNGISYVLVGSGSPTAATNPGPIDGFKFVSVTPTLSWTTGDFVTSHDVYFGTSFDAVDSATTASPQFQGNFSLSTTTYQPRTLAEGTEHFWRVDEVGAAQTVKGQVWRFTTHGLILHLTFDEGQGDTATDSSGRGNHGTLHGSPKPTWTSGRIGGGLDLGGDLDYVEINEDARVATNGSDFSDNYSSTESVSVTLWVKLNSTPGGPSDNWWIITKSIGFGGWILNGWGNDSLGFQIPGLSPATFAGGGGIDIDDGEWRHLAGVFDGSAISLYVDGAVVDSRATTGTIRWTHHKVWVGDNSANHHFGVDGTVDDVRIYSYGLSAAQVADLYNNVVNAETAWNPGPHPAKLNVPVSTALSWSAGANAVSHDVYFGTDFDNVNNSTPILLNGDVNSSGVVDAGDVLTLSEIWLGSHVFPDAAARWRLDGDALDSLGVHHGTLTNFPGDGSQWVSGKVGGALTFDGVDDFVEISGYSGVTGTQSRTVMAWIKTTAVGQIINWGNTAPGEKWVFRVQDSAGVTGAIRAEVGSGFIVGSTPVWDGTWHHVAAVLQNDGSPDISEVKLYVDGQLETVSSVTPRAINTSAVNNVTLGSFLTAPLYFNGQIDDPQIYSRALSTAEIQLLAGLNLDGEINWLDFPPVAWDWGKSSSYRGNVASTAFDPGTLSGDTAYYWRIDEVGATQTTKGPVWQFTTTPNKAWNPSPGDDKGVRDLNADLIWSPGVGAISHDIYFGADLNLVTNATTASPEYRGNQSTINYDPGPLVLDTTYYWRIDEVNGGGVVKGDVWRFTTTNKWLFYFHGRLDNAERLCAYALQGLVNRDGPRVFYVVKNNWAYQDTDITWLDYLTTVRGFKFAEIGTLRELIQLARDEGYINGLVQYNYTAVGGEEKIIAENMAGISDLLPVTAELLNYSSPALRLGTGDCFSGLTITDIRGNWTSKLNAQTWTINNQMPLKVKTGIFKHYYSEVTGDVESEVDYAVMGNYFVMTYDTLDPSEKALYDQMSAYLNQPVPLFGGAHSEWGDAGAPGCSGQGNFVLGGGATLQNLSFLGQVPVDPANVVLGKPHNNMVLDPKKYYLLFIMNEADTPKIGMTFMAGDWFHPNRGNAPVAWAFGQALIDHYPIMMEYYQHYAGPSDYFFSGAMGAGSFWPQYCPDDKLIAMAQYVETLLQRTGIIATESYGGNEFNKLQTFMVNCPSLRHVSAARFDNGTNQYFSNGAMLTSTYGATEKPDQAGGLWYAWHLPPNEGIDFDQTELTRRIKDFAATKSSPYFITIYGRPVEFATWATDGLADDPRFVIVGVEDFVHLMEQAGP